MADFLSLPFTLTRKSRQAEPGAESPLLFRGLENAQLESFCSRAGLGLSSSTAPSGPVLLPCA